MKLKIGDIGIVVSKHITFDDMWKIDWDHLTDEENEFTIGVFESEIELIK